MRLFAFLAIVALAWASPSDACSAVEGYKIPTNFELVQRAKVIVLARVTEVPPSLDTGGNFDKAQVRLEVLRYLKGAAPTDQLSLMGWQAPKNWSGVTTATTLAQSHFSTGLGACIRQFYEPGELIVVMFDSDPEMRKLTGREFNQIFDAWARAVETVDTPDDVWVHAVERLVLLQTGPPEQLSERIRAEIKDLYGRRTPAAQAIAAELEYHLSRKDPADIWTNASTPMTTMAKVHQSSGALLYCLAGTPPGMLLEGAVQKADLSIGDRMIGTKASTPSPLEEQMLGPGLEERISGKDPPKRSLFRFVDPDNAIAKLRTAIDPISLQSDGKTIASGRPLDAMLRFASQCEKLQKLPQPTAEDLKPTKN